jgi:hypothetical protein
MGTDLHLNTSANRDRVHRDRAGHDPGYDLAGPLSLAQKESLRRAVAKIVALGARVGVSADQMIELLKAGLTVRELLQYLAARAGDAA